VNLRPGALLGPYRIDAELGRGAMGAVYRAHNLQAQRDVALKVILRAENPRSVQRFIREAQVVAGLKHPGIVGVHDAGVFGGVPCIAYELVEGGRTLEEAFESLLLIERVELVLEVAAALAHVHGAGLVHRDVKPGNVLLDAQGRARLTDFGLVGGEDLERLTRTGGLVGTPAYMAPEQIECERDKIGPHSDVWALGVLLYEALTQSLPFSGQSAVEVMVRARQSAPTPPSTVTEEAIPRGAEVVCLRALAKDPAARYPDAGEFHDALSAVLDGTFHAPARLPLVAFLVVALAVIGVLGVGVSRALAPASPLASATVTGSQAAESPAPVARTTAEWASLARKRLGAGETRAALAAWTRVLESEPDHRAGLLGSAAANLDLDQHEAALAVLDRLLSLDPGHAEAYYRRANSLWVTQGGGWKEPPDLQREAETADGLFYRALVRQRAKAFSGALEDYTEVLRRRPDYVAAYNNRGNLRADLGDYRGSLDDLSEAARRSNSPEAILNRGSVLVKLGRYREALADADAALKLDPKNIRAHCARSGAFRDLGELDNAQEALEPARALNPEDERVLIESALLFTARKQIPRAQELYQRVLKRDPDHALALNNLAANYMDHGQPDLAEPLLRKVLRLQPHDATALANLAAMLLRRGQVDESVALAKRATETAPEALGLGLTYAAALIRANEPDAALAEIERLLNSDPKLARAYYIRGKALISKGQGKPALEAYDEALRLDPNSAEVLQERGTFNLNTKRYKEALADLDRLVELRADEKSHTYRGHARLQLGDKAGALADYQKALEFDPKFRDALNNLSALFAQAKEHRQALPYVNTLIEIAPEVANYWYSRADIYVALGDFESANRDCAKYRELAPGDPDGLILYGRTWQGLGKHRQALACFEPVIAKNPKNLRALAYQSESLQTVQDWAGVVQCFDRMIALLKPGAAIVGKLRKARAEALARLEAQKKQDPQR
jgi:tetratricopeptide (TPR) repeat protein